MRCRKLVCVFCLPLLAGTVAAPRAAEDPSVTDHLRHLAGCFAVTYRFVEDGVHDMFSPKWRLDEPITEWVGYGQTEQGAVVLPHVSVTDDGRAVAHWYEVWTRAGEEADWTQEVWSNFPGDAESELRYWCTAPWKQNLWDCRAGRAPKPFRDEGAPFGFNRTDYAWLDRGNTLLVTPEGWVQHEHNRKVAASGEVLARELGWITYRRVERAACGPAIEACGQKPLTVE